MAGKLRVVETQESWAAECDYVKVSATLFYRSNAVPFLGARDD